MAQRLSSIWLALIVVLGQFMPLHAAVVRTPGEAPPSAASCCMGDCCCGEMGGGSCPCAVAPTPEPLRDQRPDAPAPTRDADQCRAMLADLVALIAHPSIARAPMPAIAHERSEARNASLTTQILLGVWRN